MSNIIDIINSLNCPDDGFLFKEYKKTYWGKDRFGNIAFGLDSAERTNSIVESTRSVSLYLIIHCVVK